MPNSTILGEPLQLPEGLTIKRLKELVKDWPEVDSAGEDTEVWVGDSRGFSYPLSSIWSLNVRTASDGTPTADLMLEVSGSVQS